MANKNAGGPRMLDIPALPGCDAVDGRDADEVEVDCPETQTVPYKECHVDNYHHNAQRDPCNSKHDASSPARQHVDVCTNNNHLYLDKNKGQRSRGVNVQDELGNVRKVSSEGLEIPTPESMGIITEKPRYQQYAIISKRLDSFQGWQDVEGISIGQLAEAGFVQTGDGIAVRCFFCNGGLKSFQPYNDPWIEHALHFKHCGYVKQCKGLAFIRRVHTNILGHYDGPTDIGEEETPEELEMKYVEDKMTSDIVSSAVEIGFQNSSIKKALRHLHRTGKSTIKPTDVIEVICDIEDGKINGKSLEDAIETLKIHGAVDTEPIEATVEKDAETATEEDLEEEHELLKQQLLCRICLTKQACIIFLPCGHMFSCGQCSPALQRCAICRTPVKGSVRAIRT